MSWANNPHRLKGWRAVFSKNCPHCRTPIRGSATFCPACGQPTTRAAATMAAHATRMHFDAMTPEQQARVEAAAERRRGAMRKKAHKQAIVTLIVIAGIILFALSQAHAQSRETPIYDKDGRYNGSVFD